MDGCSEKLYRFLIDENIQTLFITNDIAVIILRNNENIELKDLLLEDMKNFRFVERDDKNIIFEYIDLNIKIQFPNEKIKSVLLNDENFGSIISCFKSNKVISSFDTESSSENSSKKSKWGWNPFKGFRKGGKKSRRSRRSKKSKKSRRKRK